MRIIQITLVALLEISQAVPYYVDCAAANDNGSGTSTITAWHTLSRANTATLAPGDQLLLKRDCSWTGPLNVSQNGNSTSPIYIGAYGIGELPRILNGNSTNVNIKASYVVVESLWAHSDPVRFDSGCANQPMGYSAGFVFSSNAAYGTLLHVRSTGHSTGGQISPGSHHCRVLYSRFEDNTAMQVLDNTNPDNDAGAFGFLVNGDDNEVAYNSFNNNKAWCSYDYGIDGSSVEIYQAKRNRIHHNISTNEGTFTELGGSQTEDNVFAYNLVTSTVAQCIFLNVRGAKSVWGPNRNTRAYNNTVYLTGAQSQGLVCGDGCNSAILTFRNNIIWSEGKGAWSDSQPIATNNIFWKSGGNPVIQNLVLDGSSLKADPLFVNVAKSDFHLQSASPARNSGHTAPLTDGFATDLDGLTIPLEGIPDMGAYEFKIGTRLLPNRTRSRGLTPIEKHRDLTEVRFWTVPNQGDYDGKGRRYLP
jgi:hypothetical protein